MSKSWHKHTRLKKESKIKLPEFETRSVIIWGLSDEQKDAKFVKPLVEKFGKIERITIVKRKPAVKVTFRTPNDAIKVRCNRKILKNFPKLYIKYGKDRHSKTHNIASATIDPDMDMLAELTGSLLKLSIENIYIYILV